MTIAKTHNNKEEIIDNQKANASQIYGKNFMLQTHKHNKEHLKKVRHAKFATQKSLKFTGPRGMRQAERISF